jgi:hypothetical protein
MKQSSTTEPSKQIENALESRPESGDAPEGEMSVKNISPHGNF